MPTFALGRATRRLVLMTHIAVSVAWLGADVVMGVLAITGLTSDDIALTLSIHRAAGVFVPLVLLPLSLLALASGLLLSLGTTWGLVRHWWVLGKLAITVVLSVLVLILLRPPVAELAADAAAQQRAGFLAGGLISTEPTDLLIPAIVSAVALSTAVILAVAKPWGRTGWSDSPGIATPRTVTPRPIGRSDRRLGESGWS